MYSSHFPKFLISKGNSIFSQLTLNFFWCFWSLRLINLQMTPLQVLAICCKVFQSRRPNFVLSILILFKMNLASILFFVLTFICHPWLSWEFQALTSRRSLWSIFCFSFITPPTTTTQGHIGINTVYLRKSKALCPELF